jgi:pyruvate/2-oxoglutarate dehydrogenase complex dihydrolipoamide dehydrogenase (E3) component
MLQLVVASGNHSRRQAEACRTQSDNHSKAHASSDESRLPDERCRNELGSVGGGLVVPRSQCATCFSLSAGVMSQRQRQAEACRTLDTGVTSFGSAVGDILETEGIRIRLNATCISLAKHAGGIAVGVDCNEGPPEVAGTHVLLAVGRTPNTNDLGLERAGVATDQRGYIIVDDQLQASVPGIWALGDCNGRGAFTHTAYNDYEIVADNLFNSDHRRVSDRIPAYGLFIDPPLGRCGLTEAEIRKSGRAALVAKYPMSGVGRAFEKGETQGFIKICVDAETKNILGAAILGTGGDEVVHVLLDVMYAKAPYTVVQRAMHIHPTVAEFLPTVLSKLEPLRRT